MAATCITRRKRGRPRKTKPDPSIVQPTRPKPTLAPILPAVRVQASTAPTPSYLGTRAMPMTNHRSGAASVGHQPWIYPTPTAKAGQSTPSPPSSSDGGQDSSETDETEQDEYDEAALEALHQDVAYRESPKRRKTQSTSTTVSPLVSSALALLSEEIKDIQKMMKEVQADLSRISTKADDYEHNQEDLERTVDSMLLNQLSSSSGNYSSTPSTSTSTSFISRKHPTIATFPQQLDLARVARKQFLLRFPFLERYRLDVRDVPFVVDDLNKPLLVVRLLPTHTLQPTPVIVYANDALCRRLGYVLNELLGCSANKIAQPDQARLDSVKDAILHRMHRDMTEVLHLRFTLRAKEGTLLVGKSRYQIFLDDEENVEYGVQCIDSIDVPKRREDMPRYSIANGQFTSPVLGVDILSLLFPTYAHGFQRRLLSDWP